jgi:glycine betaine/choline ABC-type transport system substrate-binding protein
LRKHQSKLKTGFGPEFMSRADGYDGLIKAYRLNFTVQPRELDRNLLYQAVSQGTLDVAAGDSTDGRIAALDLVVLEDDRHYFPPYEAIVMVHAESLKRPGLAECLGALVGKIDGATMRRLNYEVDGKRRDAAEVAREFLMTTDLLKQ